MVNEAYELILGIDDDLYLIRLMCKTGACFEELGREVGVKLYGRVGVIARTNFIDQLIVDFLSQGAKGGMGESLTSEMKREAERQIEKLNRKIEDTVEDF
jgi:hypothetical protein